MAFDLREHTADVAVEAEADTLDDLFADVAAGMTAAMAEEWLSAGDRFDFEERAESKEALLFDYLDRLIYERDVRSVLPVDHEADVSREDDEWVVEASARGVPLSEVAARDLKAVTYSDMVVEERDSGWHAYVVFDV